MMGFFSLCHQVQTSSGAHPASCPMCKGASSSEVKRPEREANHSPPFSVKIKYGWNYTSTPQCIFMAWCIIKHWIHLHGMVLSFAQEQIYLYLTFMPRVRSI